MCGHIIHEKESKLMRWGVTQASAYSQNSNGGYTMIYIIIYTTFEVLRLKIISEGTLVQMGVTKQSVASTKELQNQL